MHAYASPDSRSQLSSPCLKDWGAHQVHIPLIILPNPGRPERKSQKAAGIGLVIVDDIEAVDTDTIEFLDTLR
jgi:hypothetical protein